MPSDPRAARARQEHRLSVQSSQDADQHRAVRNELIKALRTEDPERWTYVELGKAVGISPESVAAIMNGRVGK